MHSCATTHFHNEQVQRTYFRLLYNNTQHLNVVKKIIKETTSELRHADYASKAKGNETIMIDES